MSCWVMSNTLINLISTLSMGTRNHTHTIPQFCIKRPNLPRYDVVISSDVARTRTNGCIFFKLRDPSVDVLPTHYYSHKFVCVAPYNTDTLLLINIPKTMLEKVIKVSIIQSYQLSIFTHSLFTPTKKCNIHSRRKLPKTLLKEKSKIFLLQLIMVNPDSLLSLSLSCLDC